MLTRAWVSISSGLAMGLLCAGCGGGGSGGPAAAGAAGALALGVATAGVNRAITKDCWARCSNGYVCNQESGLCEKGECIPSCAPGYACTKTQRGTSCIAQGTPAFDPVGDPSRADRLGPRGVRGDPFAPTTPAEQNTRAPEKNEGGQVQLAPGRRQIGDPPDEPEEKGSNDDAQRPLREEAIERGASIFPELEALVARWRPRIAASESTHLEMAGPPSQELLTYLESLHEHSLHAVYSAGFLGSLLDLSATHALSNHALEVTLGLVVSGETGKLERALLLKSSGSELFDVGALEALTRAAPFPPPPEALLAEDGKLHLKWRLFRHPDYACSTSFVNRLKPRDDETAPSN